MNEKPKILDALVIEKHAEEYFNQLNATLKAIPGKDVITLTMPPEEASAEASKMDVVVDRDGEELLAKGVKQEYVTSFKARVGALIYAIAALDGLVSQSADAKEEWKKMKPVGYSIKNELIVGYEWALRNVESAQEALLKIRMGKGNKDMIGDLLALNILGSQHKDLLEQYGVELSLLAQAKELNAKLSFILAHTVVDPLKYDELNDQCNRAWTYLKEALDEIYPAGRYAFRNDPEKLDDYTIDYYRSLGERSAKAVAQQKKLDDEVLDTESTVSM